MAPLGLATVFLFFRVFYLSPLPAQSQEWVDLLRVQLEGYAPFPGSNHSAAVRE